MTVAPSRRQLLAAAALLPVAACTTSDDRPARVDPDDALRAAAVERERALLSSYDAVLAALPTLAARLAPLRAEHEQHLAALAAPSPSPSPSAAPTVRTVAQLVALERTTAAAHATDALSASRELAMVLASLAASEASHPVGLA